MEQITTVKLGVLRPYLEAEAKEEDRSLSGQLRFILFNRYTKEVKRAKKKNHK